MVTSRGSKPLHRSSFTLIELLVVVTIIAILAAMLLPMLQQTKDAARSSVCINNLRTLTMTCQLYADDYNEYFPDCFMTNAPNNYYNSWYGYVRHYLPGVKGTIDDLSLADLTLNPPGIFMDFRNVNPFASTVRYQRKAIYNNPFFCPATVGEYADGTSLSVIAINACCWSDYGMNFAAAGAPRWNSTFLKTRRSDFKAPDRTILLADAYFNGFGFGNASRYAISPRHGGRTRTNVALVDGHIESCRWSVVWGNVSYQDISISSASSGPSGFKAYLSP